MVDLEKNYLKDEDEESDGDDEDEESDGDDEDEEDDEDWNE